MYLEAAYPGAGYGSIIVSSEVLWVLIVNFKWDDRLAGKHDEGQALLGQERHNVGEHGDEAPSCSGTQSSVFAIGLPSHTSYHVFQ